MWEIQALSPQLVWTKTYANLVQKLLLSCRIKQEDALKEILSFYLRINLEKRRFVSVWNIKLENLVTL